MQAAKYSLALLVALCGAVAPCASSAGPRAQAGDFDYYALVLTWSPTYCRSSGQARHDPECTGGGSHSFTLHGLWPQYDKGWPEDCPIGKRPWVPGGVIDEMREIMPSRNLIIHEYRTHGTCSGLDPAQYFGVALNLYDRVIVPAALTQGDAALSATPEEIEQAFVDANAWLKPSMMAVSCRGANLLDVRFCFGRDLFPRACGLNEDQQRLCRADRVTVPPPKR
jgi:ribonuclease T2